MKHLYFWLTLTGIIYTISVLVFMIACAALETITVSKSYCLILIPLLLYLLMQTIINYSELTDETKK